MERSNYKDNDYIGLHKYTDRIFLTIIDTGAGHNFIRRSNLPVGTMN